MFLQSFTGARYYPIFKGTAKTPGGKITGMRSKGQQQRQKQNPDSSSLVKCFSPLKLPFLGEKNEVTVLLIQQQPSHQLQQGQDFLPDQDTFALRR